MTKPLIEGLEGVDHSEDKYGKWVDRQTPRKTPTSVARELTSSGRKIKTPRFQPNQIDKFNPDLKYQLMEEHKAEEEKIKREQEAQREKDLQTYK